MLEGLKDIEAALKERRIKLIVRRGSSDEVALELGRDASMIVCDMSYLRLQKEWRERMAKDADCLVAQVETEVVMPVELASDKREHAARTLRPGFRNTSTTFSSSSSPLRSRNSL